MALPKGIRPFIIILTTLKICFFRPLAVSTFHLSSPLSHMVVMSTVRDSLAEDPLSLTLLSVKKVIII
jgi:hypothetical protein